MVTRNDDWIIWLTPQAGEVLLGLLPSSPVPASPVPGNRRFCVLGKLEGPDRSDVGVWIDVDFVQELTNPDNTSQDMGSQSAIMPHPVERHSICSKR